MCHLELALATDTPMYTDILQSRGLLCRFWDKIIIYCLWASLRTKHIKLTVFPTFSKHLHFANPHKWILIMGRRKKDLTGNQLDSLLGFLMWPLQNLLILLINLSLATPYFLLGFLSPQTTKFQYFRLRFSGLASLHAAAVKPKIFYIIYAKRKEQRSSVPWPRPERKAYISWFLVLYFFPPNSFPRHAITEYLLQV